MGFGILLIGYLVTYVLKLTADGIGAGGFALLLGYGLMMYGLWKLNRFHSAFAFAKWLCVPLLFLGAVEAAFNVTGWFSLPTGWYEGTIQTALAWAQFLGSMVFHAAMLYAIRMLAKEVGLPTLSIAAVRNSVFVALYALLYLASYLPFSTETVKKYLAVPCILTLIFFVALNLWLFLSCAKNICAEGEDEPEPKRYKLGFLNKINDKLLENEDRAVESTKREAEERLRRRREKRESKKQRKKGK